MKIVKTEFNDETREYLSTYFLLKPCTPSTMDYIFYNMFNTPFSIASSSVEFNEYENENESLLSIENFIIQISKKYLFHYQFIENENTPVKGVIESWVHTYNEENEDYENIHYRYDQDRWDEDDTVITLIFWMKSTGELAYRTIENDKGEENEDEKKNYEIPIERNTVAILLNDIEYQPYLGKHDQQYIIVQIVL